MKHFFIVIIALTLSACGGSAMHKSQVENHSQASPNIQSILSIGQAERAYNRNPTDESVALNYARLLRQQGTLNRASAILSSFGEISENPEVFAELSHLYRVIGDNTLSQRYARRALQISPDNAQAQFALAQSFDAIDQFEKAEVAYEKARELFSYESIELLNKLALTKASLDKFHEAEELLRIAKSASPKDQEVLRNIRIIQALIQSYSATAPKPNTKPKTP